MQAHVSKRALSGECVFVCDFVLFPCLSAFYYTIDHDESIRTIRIVSERFITSAAQVTPDNAANRAPIVDLNAPLVALSVDKLREREAKQLARLKKAAQQLNTHATPQAQALFNSLAKTMPCRWAENNSIVVFEGKFTVRVSEPYTDASVVGTDEPSVARVKLVLNGEKAKLKN
jgi:hypothetical protein